MRLLIAFVISLIASMICVGALVAACETDAWGERGAAGDATRLREHRLDEHFRIGPVAGEAVAK